MATTFAAPIAATLFVFSVVACNSHVVATNDEDRADLASPDPVYDLSSDKPDLSERDLLAGPDLAGKPPAEKQTPSIGCNVVNA